MTAALTVRGLSKRYGAVEALRGVSFEVMAGEVFGLLGPNGAGKTTCIECVLGLRRADEGDVTVEGGRERLGAQLQATALQDRITPREALRLFGAFYEKFVPADELLERFRLGRQADARFSSLSAGQRQRLGVALALVNDPLMLLLDEPTAGLDAQSRREFYALVRELKGEGRTIVLSTHYIEEAQQLCDRVGIIDRGRIVALGRPGELIARSSAAVEIMARLRRGGEVIVRQESIGAAVAELVRRAEGDEIEELEVRRATLEDVFLELTGTKRAGEERMTLTPLRVERSGG